MKDKGYFCAAALASNLNVTRQAATTLRSAFDAIHTH